MAPKCPPPLVTGVSPKEGPPGTRITIRGENLGNDPRDLIGLKICEMDCLLSAEWKSSSKIIARTGPGKGKGDIIAITRSGGKGSCTVGFRGYFLQTGPLQESAVWVDESLTVRPNLDHGRPTASIAAKEEEDPLGILDEGDKVKLTEEELLEMFQDGSGNMSLENFSPGWYLLEHHQNASFEDLKAGLSYMKRKASQRSEGPITIVRSNLTSILDCLDSLSSMYEKYSEDDIRGNCMNSYAVLLMQAKSCADGLFQEVLGRKDKADSTRNALSVIQKFRFLFHLPLNIQRNIQKGDYNMVINDYEKAKSLFADTEIKVFKKVYRDVERRITNFRDMLYKRLKDPNNTLDEQKKLIRYLVSLEHKGDPAWECLDNQQKWLIELLDDCKDDHIEEEKNSLQESLSSSQNTNHWRPKNHLNKSPTKSGLSRESSFSSISSADHHSSWRFKTPQKVLFVEDITDIMLQHFPDYWRLGQSYFTREKSEKGVKIDTSKHGKMKQMMTEVITLFSNYVRAAFLPESLENLPENERVKFGVWPSSGKQDHVSGAWLPTCVRNIRNCSNTLSALDGHGDAMIVLNELAFDMRTNCMFTLLKQAIIDVKSLHTKETWVVETDDESGGTTQLPALFENIVNETIQHLHEVVVMNKAPEPEIFSQRPIQKEATALCSQLLQAFSVCMEQLVFSPPLQKTETKHNVKILIGQDIELEQHEDPIPSMDKRLIIMLSNCSHTLNHVIPRTIENLTKHGYVQMEKALKAAQDSYSDLDNRLFSSYIEQKSDPILGVMEPNMYRGGFNWKTWKNPTGVRNYLKEIIMSLTEVHAEVYSISPRFVMRVMKKITEAVCEEVSRLIQCVTEFNACGAIQARLELEALQSTVKIYSTPHVQNSFKAALACVPELSEEGKQVVAQLLDKFRSRMKIQLMCFNPDISSPTTLKKAQLSVSKC
ncbi:exocyst complex component 2-like [Physella acuta]|uniref:exocyst complex component 2-like n=1 Tax=Physella acuta TaxID=109671 RepID=UPI0027DC910E|nr:exocyst complex component 2-like [Physella acuta]XP_059170245.1 exocyst complex component 2-like [Physella acuta]